MLAITETVKHLNVSSELETVLSEPGLAAGSADGMVEPFSMTQATRTFASLGKTTQFSVLLCWGTDPVDPGVTPDSLVEGINENNFKIFVSGILGNPVRVQHTQSTKSSTNPLFSNGLKVSLWLLLFDSTRALGLTIGASLGNGTFSSSTSHTDSVDNISLLLLVT